jgi:aryl-alcohol dehydrogenase
LRLFAPLGCGVQTGSGVLLNTLKLQKGDSIAISGCGAVGMSAIMMAKERKAANIIAIDLSDERLKLAGELGATHCINSGDPESTVAEMIHRLLPNGVQYAFDTTAVPQVIESMIESTGIRGKTVVVGATPFDKTIRIQPLKFLNMGKHFIGSVEGDSYPPEVSSAPLVRSRHNPENSLKAIPHLIELNRSGSLLLDKIIKYYKFADFATAFQDLQSGKAIKPVIVFDDED